MTKNSRTLADIVLITVNKHEQTQLTQVLETHQRTKLKAFQGPSNEVYLDAGFINQQRVILAKSLIGSTESGASFDTATNVINDLSPKLVIAAGIAWGAKEGSGQQIGDILISTRLRAGHHQKVVPGKVIPRGTIQAASGTILKIFSAAADMIHKRVHEGLLISVETLFDDKESRDKFIAADEGQAIGGEMEGSGLLMSLQRVGHKVDWLVVKAICDWGFKKNISPVQKEEDQRMAALNAAELCLAAISNFRLIDSRLLSEASSEISEIVSPAFEQIRSNHQVDALPERSIEKTVHAYIGKNSSFSLDVGFPIKHKDWNEKVVFELYKLTEELGSTKYFLYVHESASQSGTLLYLRQNNLLKRSNQLIVLTEKPAFLKESEKRTENLKAVFETSMAFFIDDFGRNFLYKEHIQTYVPFRLPVYVESLANTTLPDQSNSALHQLKSWYQSTSAPLVVIKGYGGIGKTTLVKQFLDEIHVATPEAGILFIDSHEIIGELESISRTRQKIDDIYDFYNAQSISQTGEAKRLTKDLLSLSVDNGSLVIVLDGIDEVISKLGAKFDAVSFINSISTIYSTNLRRAKIIVTCRDYFWDSLQEVQSVEKIDLQPFNRNMAEEFFLKSLGVQSQVDKAMEIADKLALRTQEEAGEVYVPYILDLIVYLIKQQGVIGEETFDPTSFGSLLNPNISNDFLVANVCKREVVKLNNLSVDNQIEFFVQMSIARDGHVSIYDVKPLLTRLHAGDARSGDDTIEKLKGHPLLVCSSNRLYFRYDFFNEYFKSLYIAKFFLERNLKELNDDFVEVAANYLRFDGEFMRSVCQRLSMDDETLLFAVETAEKLAKKCNEDSRIQYNYQRARSAVFCLFLDLLRNSNVKFDVDRCTELMKNFFEENGEINGLSLINVGTNSSLKPIFDFRGRKLNECYFERYDFFWECLIDEDTRFHKSTFKALEPRKAVRPHFFDSTFDDCDTTSIAHLLAKKKETATQHMLVVRDELVRLFRLFYSRGNFYPQKQEHIRGRMFTGPYLPLLLKHRVIEEYVDAEKATLRQYRIRQPYMPIVKHLEQGGPSIELDQVAKLFAK